MRPNLGILILPLLALPVSGDDADDKIKNYEEWWWPGCTEYGVVKNDGTESFFKATCHDGAGNSVATELDLNPCCASLAKNRDDKTHETRIERCMLRKDGPPGQNILGCYVHVDDAKESKWTPLTWWAQQYVAVKDGVLTCFDHEGQRV